MPKTLKKTFLPAKYVDCQDPEAPSVFCGHDGLHCFVQDCIARIPGRLGVGGHLGQHVAHEVTSSCVFVAQHPQQLQDLWASTIQLNTLFLSHASIKAAAPSQLMSVAAHDSKTLSFLHVRLRLGFELSTAYNSPLVFMTNHGGRLQTTNSLCVVG